MGAEKPETWNTSRRLFGTKNPQWNTCPPQTWNLGLKSSGNISRYFLLENEWKKLIKTLQVLFRFFCFAEFSTYSEDQFFNTLPYFSSFSTSVPLQCISGGGGWGTNGVTLRVCGGCTVPYPGMVSVKKQSVFFNNPFSKKLFSRKLPFLWPW